MTSIIEIKTKSKPKIESFYLINIDSLNDCKCPYCHQTIKFNKFDKDNKYNGSCSNHEQISIYFELTAPSRILFPNKQNLISLKYLDLEFNDIKVKLYSSPHDPDREPQLMRQLTPNLPQRYQVPGRMEKLPSNFTNQQIFFSDLKTIKNKIKTILLFL